MPKSVVRVYALLLLLSQAFAVNFLAELFDELLVESKITSIGNLLVQHLLPSFGLEERHVVLSLDGSYGSGYFHSTTE